MKESISKKKKDPDKVETNGDGCNVSESQDKMRAWKDIWSAGQGVGLIKKIESVESIVKELETEFFKG